MNNDRDARLSAIFDEIVARTPDLGPTPAPELLSVAHRDSSGRRVLLAAAASVVAIGVAGLAWAVTANNGSVGPAAAPTDSTAETFVMTPNDTQPPVSSSSLNPAVIAPTSPPSDAPTADVVRGGPTLYPVLAPAAVSDAPLTGNLTYVGANVRPQTNAVVARFGEDGSTTDIYTFVAGDGVSGYVDGLGIATDTSTPQLTNVGGFGYAAWTTNEVLMLVMASDPTVLLDNPAFSMNITSSADGTATIEFESLPEGFETLVAPRRFARETATAQLLIGSPGAPGAVVGSVAASLDNPLSNVNLTEGSTISPTSPTQAGDIDGWVVSFPDSGDRAVVWSPDGTTWVSLHWSGSEEDLSTLARDVTFTDNAGEWMTTYGVDLPPIHFDAPTASG